MEFVALGVLGVFGYLGSHRHSDPPKSSMNPKIPLRTLEQQFKNDVAAHMQHEQVVLPYFRSEKSQNTNDSLKDRRLQTFTGNQNIDYKAKKEVEAPAPVRDLTSLYGCTFSPNYDVYKNSLTGKQHNVSPVEPQYIGPGLHEENPGFHEYFRIMPDNVNGYRKNTFTGDVIHGHHAVARTLDSFENTRDNNLTDTEFARLGERSMDARFSSVTAARQNAPVVLKATQGEMNGSHNVGASFANAGNYLSGTVTRDHDRTCESNRTTGGAFVTTGTGGYQNARYFHNDTDRETVNTHRTNVGGNAFGTYTSSEAQFATSRETAHHAPVETRGSQAPTVRLDSHARPTQRQQTQADYYGAAFASAGHTVADTHLDRSTYRGQANEQGDVGRGATIQSAARSDARVEGYQKAIVANHEPNVQRTINAMSYDIRLTREGTEQANRICSNPQGFVPTPVPTGKMYLNDKTPVENHRDFGYAPQNPLVTNIRRDT